MNRVTFIQTGLLHVPVMDTVAGEAVAKMLIGALRRVVIQQESYAANDRRWLEDTLCKWCDEDELDLVVTIGGTLPAPGPSALEIVPEATSAVIERFVPGLAEAMRAAMREEFPGSALHRGVAGIRGRTLIVNLPAGVEAASLFLEAILEDLPFILAHLRAADAPMTPAQIIRQGEGEEVEGAGKSAPNLTESPPMSNRPSPAEPGRKGLNAEEFAAFLRRDKPTSE